MKVQQLMLEVWCVVLGVPRFTCGISMYSETSPLLELNIIMWTL